METLRTLIDRLNSFGRKEAIVVFERDGVERLDYVTLHRRVVEAAGRFRTRGLRRGDRVAIVAPPGPDWIIACLGAIGAGVVVMPIDEQIGRENLRRVIDDGEPALVLTIRRHMDRLRQAGLDDDRLNALDGPMDERHWTRLNPGRETALDDPSPEDEAVLFYTSGTTGPPKGVALTHRNLTYQLNAIAQAGLVKPDDRLLLPLPLHHVYPFSIGMLTPLWLGLPIIFPRSLTGPELVRSIREGAATAVIGVPRLYRALSSAIDDRVQSGGAFSRRTFECLLGLSGWLHRAFGVHAGRILLRPLHRQFGTQLRLLASGGSPLDAELAARLQAIGWRIAIGYGLTETAPLLTINHPDRFKAGSVGRPLEGVEIRIDTSVEVEQSEAASTDPEREPRRGEVLAKGPNVFHGYRGLPEQTAEAFTDDGYFRTGDLGFLDEDGYLHIDGRASTLIVTESGKNIQPDEVEEAYAASPRIHEIGVLQNERGLVALIVPNMQALRGMDEPAIRAAIREAINERSRALPSYERLVDFALTREPLPRTRLGKLRRHTLKERYAGAKSGSESFSAAGGPMPIESMSEDDQTLLEDQAARRTWEYLAERYPDQPLSPDSSPQLDLGVDSMEWLNLTMEIGRRAGVTIDEEAIGRVSTVRDLLREVVEGSHVGGTETIQRSVADPEGSLSPEQKRWLEPLNRLERGISWLLYWLNFGLTKVLFRVRAIGVDRLPDDRPYVLAANHISLLDPFVLATAIGYRRMKRTYWGGWTGVAFTNRLTRLGSRLARVVPIDPDRGPLSSLVISAAVIHRGHNLAIFPEGERSESGRLQRFKPGLGVVLEQHPAVVVPTYIDGTHEALPPGRFWPRPRRVEIRFGEPVDSQKLADEGQGQEMRDRIMDALQRRVDRLGGLKPDAAGQEEETSNAQNAPSAP